MAKTTKLKVLLNIGTDDAAKFKIPMYQQDEVIDADERVSDILLNQLGCAEEINA